MTRLHTQVMRLAAVLAGLLAVPALASAQRPLVYCPVGIDETGCSAVVNALGDADRAYDGSMGTVDLRTADLGAYTVLVIPSLADDGASHPYALLRDAQVADRLRGLLLGRRVFWSGTPDLGSSARADKDALIQRLAGWAAGNHATVNAPGLLVLQDRSADVGQRYAWVEALTGQQVVADPALQSYAQVRSLTAVGVELVGGAAFTNMASLGFYLPHGAPGLSLDAVGSTGSSVGGQVVLMTAPGGNTGSARVWTNKDDYVPDEMVLMLGAGFEAGETITLELTEDPSVHDGRSFTVTADANGAFTFDEFRPEEHHLGVRFVLTATGNTSGVRAQTTFTDGIVLAAFTTNQNGDPFTSELTIARPALAVGHLMVAQVTLDNFGGTDVICPPAGWTSIRRTQNSSATIQHLFYRVATAGDVTTPSYTFRFRASSCSGSTLPKGASGGIIAYSGVDTGHPSGPIVNSAGSVGTNTTITAPNIASVPVGSRVVRYFGNDKEFNIATAGTNTALIYSQRRIKSGGFEKPTAAAADGEQLATGTTTNVTGSNSGNGGNWVAQTVILRVSPCTAPGITLQPNNAAVAYGDNATFTAGASGSPAPTVQWQMSTDAGANWANLPGETGASLTLVKPAVARTGQQFRAVFTNSCGTATSSAATLTVSARAVTGSFTAADKIYDGNATASITGRAVVGAVAGDDVSLSGGAAAFADANVGASKPVSGSGFGLTGAHSANYTLTSVSDASASITALAITGSFTAADKVYDGTDVASITGGSLAGVLGTDDVSLAGGSAQFADKHVGAGKVVNGFGFTLAGDDADNYTLSGVGATSASITPLSITGSFTAADKEYDGNANATITGRFLQDAIAGDDVSLAGGAASFADASVGQNKPVNGSGFVLAGTDRDNYALTSVSNTTASITPRVLAGSFTASDKVYDGTTAATVASTDLQGVSAGDQVTLVVSNAQFDSKHAGTGKDVTATLSLTGADADNYSVNASHTTQASITVLALTGSFTAADRPYDGTRVATVAGTSLPGAIVGDDVALVVANALFDTKDVGSGKDVAGELSLMGADAGNYSVNPSHTTQASITALVIAGSFTASDKVYDGTRAASVTGTSLPGVIAGEVVELVVGEALFDTKSVGMDKDVTAALSLTGADAGNYTVNASHTAQASITALALTGSFTAADKVYDGSRTASVASTSLPGVIDGDEVALVVADALFDTKDAATGKDVTGDLSLSGADAGNYTVNASHTTQASITELALTGSFTAEDRVYDGTTAATVASTSLPGVVDGDDVALVVSNAQFDTKHVGNDKQVSGELSLSGGDAPNYTVNSSHTTLASITARELTGSFTASDRVYDGTRSAAVASTDLQGVLSPDQVTLVVSNAQFDTKDVGSSKDVSGELSLTGTDAGNYSVNGSHTAQASITAKPLTASFTANHKVYDGTTAATVASTDLPGVVAGDGVELVVGNAQFDTKDVGTGKNVTAALSITGPDAGNYTVNDAHTAQANITPKALTVTAESESKDIGQPDPYFGVLYDGFVNGEDQSVLGGYVGYTFRGVSPTSYGPSSTPPQRRGSYTIRPWGHTSTNYAITYVDGYYAIAGATYLFLDDDAIRKGSPPSGFTAPSFTDADLNESKTRIGQREQLAWFANPANHGKVIDLPSGQVGDEGWFTLKTVPSTWASAGPTNNGLRNLLRAGPGLGGGTNREALLDKVRDVTPLRATGLKLLEGSTVCAIVWKSDISINYGPLSGSLKGDNRGIIAFEVVAVTAYGSGSTLPRVSVRVLDANTTSGICSEPLAPHSAAPTPTSSSSPMDVRP